MRRGDYWLVFVALCEAYPDGVELLCPSVPGAYWECTVRTRDGIRRCSARRVEEAVECVAQNLGITIEMARAAA